MIDLKTYLESDLKDCEERLNQMENYMKLKMEEGDWHAVADAAMDIREIMSRVKTNQELIGLIRTNQFSGLTP